LTDWLIEPSYKFDLACFCNLFSDREQYRKAHPEGWKLFADLFREKQEFLELAHALNNQGFLVSSALIAIFDSNDYKGMDIDKICEVAEKPELRENKLRPYFLNYQILDAKQWEQYSPLMEQLTALARHIHGGGFPVYWQESCLTEIENRCDEFRREVVKYPVLEEVNALLGEEYARKKSTISLYPGKFAAPFGTSLAGQGFVSDIRWKLEQTIAVAIHEMLHPPFDREELNRIGERLVGDDLVREARELLPPYYYATPGLFLEENVVEGAQVFLAEKLGLEKDPLKYFIEHDQGSHVISVLVYDYLKRPRAGEKSSLEQIILDMVEQKILFPGNIKKNYLVVYEKAGKLGQVPFKF